MSINITSKSETTISPIKRPRNQIGINHDNTMISPVMIPEMEFSRKKVAMEIY